MSPSEALDQIKTSDWIALCALCVAFLSLGVSMWELLKNRPEIIVRPTNVIYVADTDRVPDIGVDVLNRGRQPTVIKSIYLRLSDGKNAWPVTLQGFEGELPFRLNPGDLTSYLIPGSPNFYIGKKTYNAHDALNKNRAKIAVEHTWSNKPVFGRLKSKRRFRF